MSKHMSFEESMWKRTHGLLVRKPKSRREQLAAIQTECDRERAYQDKRWGTIEENPHTVFEWLGIAENELSKARREWFENGEYACLNELMHVYAVIRACFEQHGVTDCNR